MTSGIAQNIVIAVVLFCLGCACMHLICLLCGGKRRLSTRQSENGRFSAFCVLLSIAVGLYTLLVFVRKDLLWFSALFSDKRHVVFFIAWVLIGSLVGLRWKIFVPTLALLYAVVSVISVFLLQSAYGKQGCEYAVRLEENAIFIGDMHFVRDSDKFQTIVFSVRRLDDLVLLPTPRVWYCFEQLNEDTGDYFCDGYYSGDVFLQEMAAPDGTEVGFFKNICLRLGSLLMEPKQALYVPVPKNVLLPALFRLRVIRNFMGKDYQFVRDL